MDSRRNLSNGEYRESKTNRNRRTHVQDGVKWKYVVNPNPDRYLRVCIGRNKQRHVVTYGRQLRHILQTMLYQLKTGELALHTASMGTPWPTSPRK